MSQAQLCGLLAMWRLLLAACSERCLKHISYVTAALGLVVVRLIP